MIGRYARAIASAFLVALAVNSGYLFQREGAKQKLAMETAAKNVIARKTKELGRPVYPYSVIPGGVRSADELSKAVARDAVVRDHYSDFKLDRVRFVTVNEDRYAYVSYRRHDRVFWTQQKLRIAKGEVLLTDGQNWARARCGNRLSEEAQATDTEAAKAEPSEFVLDSKVSYRPIPLEVVAAQEALTLPLAADRLALVGPTLPASTTLLGDQISAPESIETPNALFASIGGGTAGVPGGATGSSSGAGGGAAGGGSGSVKRGSAGAATGKNSGETEGPASGQTSGVPEPGNALLVGFGFLVLLAQMGIVRLWAARRYGVSTVRG